MSSMRNAIQRRVHKERGQLHERRHLGHLEKHKDYSLRAADYNKKKKTLRSLHAKAAARNEDEFYFGMLSRRGPGSALTAGGMPSDAAKQTSGKRSWNGTVSTRGGDRGDGVRRLGVDAVRLLKTQDVGYVRTTRRVAERELARVEEKARLVGVVQDDDGDDERGGKRSRGGDGRGVVRRIVFCEDVDERAELVNAKNQNGKRPRSNDSNDDDNDDDDDEFEDISEDGDKKMGGVDSNNNNNNNNNESNKEKARAKAREKLRKRLEHTRRKVKVLAEAEQALDEQRAKMAKTATSGGTARGGRQIVVNKRKR